MSRTIFRGLLAGLVLFAAPSARGAMQEPADSSLLAMRALDQRVAAIGYRLAVAGRALCRRIDNLPGFAVHDLSQYGADFRPAAIRSFGLDAGPGVLALVPGGPAERSASRLAGRELGRQSRRHPSVQPGL